MSIPFPIKENTYSREIASSLFHSYIVEKNSNRPNIFGGINENQGTFIFSSPLLTILAGTSK